MGGSVLVQSEVTDTQTLYAHSPRVTVWLCGLFSCWSATPLSHERGSLFLTFLCNMAGVPDGSEKAPVLRQLLGTCQGCKLVPLAITAQWGLSWGPKNSWSPGLPPELPLRTTVPGPLCQSAFHAMSEYCPTAIHAQQHMRCCRPESHKIVG